MGKKRQVHEVVNIYEAKTHLSKLVDRVSEGAEVVIAKAGKPKARLVPYLAELPARVSGRGKGQWRVNKDFDSPLPDEVIAGFEGREP
jgi:prevent-host-death family protein